MKNACILFLVFCLILVSIPGRAASPAREYLRELHSDRFVADDAGIITDRSTGLQWRIAPKEERTWTQGQSWINALGNGWRTPTRVELRGIYIPTEQRSQEYPFRHIAVWAEAGDATSAWGFFFTDGNCFSDGRNNSMWYIRDVYAVRSTGHSL